MTDARVSRGRKSEDLLAEYFQDVWPDAASQAASLNGTDLLNTPGFAIEVKARRGFRPLEWGRQAARNATGDEIPLVVVRMTGQGPASLDEWLSFTPLKYQKRLIKEAGYGIALGGISSSQNSQARQLGLGLGVDEFHDLGLALSEAAGAAILRGLETYRRR